MKTNRADFIKSFLAFFAFPKAQEHKSELVRLEYDYYVASNALNDYKHKHGFEPGKKVRCERAWRDEPNKPPIFGVIAPYGDRWAHADATSVIVDFEKYTQPWPMKSLTILE